MNILVINCGSSSLKYQLIDMDTEEVLAKGLVERIGIEGSRLVQKAPNKAELIINEKIEDHHKAIELVMNALVDKESGVINSTDQISAVGHRVVHGGEKYNSSVIITEEVENEIENLSKLAPLHNPANLIGIKACKKLMPNTKMVAVFDTAFHSTIPEEAFMYAIPYDLYKQNNVRKYGFHGTSHKYVSNEVAKKIGKDIKDLKIITCHLGNGSSLCAIKNGISIDTTMGFTPLEGVPMGTRSGNIDPQIVQYLMKEKNYSIEEVDHLLNKESGVLGLSGISSDFRDLDSEASKGNERAKLALNVFYYRIKSQIGAYAAILGGIDVIVFTAGVGENGPDTRAGILSGLEFLGINLDKEANLVRGELKEISSKDSKVKVFVVPTNEELVIARETMEL